MRWEAKLPWLAIPSSTHSVGDRAPESSGKHRHTRGGSEWAIVRNRRVIAVVVQEGPRCPLASTPQYRNTRNPRSACPLQITATHNPLALCRSPFFPILHFTLSSSSLLFLEPSPLSPNKRHQSIALDVSSSRVGSLALPPSPLPCSLPPPPLLPGFLPWTVSRVPTLPASR